MPASGPSVFGPSGPLLLAIETAGSRCSAAILRGGDVLAAECRALRHGHAEALLPMIDRTARAAGIEPGDLQFVAVATGPGGFTGIRAGLAAGQGIALASGARLVGVTSFAAVAAAARGRGASDGSGALLVALDSRRDDLYVQLFAEDWTTPLAEPASVPPDRLASDVDRMIGRTSLVIAGDQAELAADMLGRDRPVSVMPDPAPDALGVAAAALFAIDAAAAAPGITADSPVRPFYLRPPDVTLPKPGPNAAESKVESGNAGFGGRVRSPRLAPLPAGAAEPLSLMHGACFPDDPWDAGAFAQILALHGVFGYVAWLGDAPAGFVVARDLGGEAEILTIGILPRMRRRGLGRALLDAVVAQAGERRFGSAVLEVAADNEAARRLYESAGFVQIGARPRYYRRGDGRIDALILRLPIGAATDGAERRGKQD